MTVPPAFLISKSICVRPDVVDCMFLPAALGCSARFSRSSMVRLSSWTLVYGARVGFRLAPFERLKVGCRGHCWLLCAASIFADCDDS